MKVCGFSFVRNGVKFDYPFEEAIRSILPLCDEVIVAVGKSEDNTLERVKAIDPKVKVVETIWNETLREGGRVLACETDKAFQAIPDDYDWAFYIQGDEVIHEHYLPAIRKAMEDNLANKEVDGLLFNYTHFFGSYEFVGLTYSWYRREVRIVRNKKNIFSYRDAQGFRKNSNEKLNVKLIDATVFHYGYVKEPVALQLKQVSMVKHYHDDTWIQNFFQSKESYQYEGVPEPVKRFEGTHPAVMKERIERKNWPFTPFPKKYASNKDKFKRLMLAWTGWMPGEYKNYKLLK
jgi:glycosyltransferase involved in cell wall biosynthesis